MKIYNKIINNIKDNLFGSYNYQKFVVITRSRTGSNLFISLLNAHSQIRAYGEKFNVLRDRTTKEIYNSIFPSKSFKKAIGFKIFYYHPQGSDDQSIWDFLINDKSIKIFHLQRKNLLKVHTSRLIALNSNQWGIKGKPKRGERNYNKKVLIDINELISDIYVTKKYIGKINNDFINHSMHKIYYNDIVNNKQKVIKKCFKFLGLPNEEVQSDLRKQNKEPLKNLIINYEEVVNTLEQLNMEWMSEE